LRIIEAELVDAQLNQAGAAGGAAPSVAFIGVERFSQVLARGEKVAQALLLNVADRLADNMRRCDAIGRIGDGVFAICMPKMTLAGAEIIAERLRNVVASAPFDIPDGPMSATVTVGVVECSISDTIATIIMRSEAAMRAAKEPTAITLQ
jgi:two-component system cell cycle response regulator